jgi:hypothetical protein
MPRHILSVLAYVAATFATQATSHFLINPGHYAEVSFMRKDPIFPLGILSMVIEGAVLSLLFSALPRSGRWLADGLKFGWLAGAFAIGYAALAEAAKYHVPSVGSWILVESLAAFVQFTLAGMAIGFIHRADPVSGTSDAALS